MWAISGSNNSYEESKAGTMTAVTGVNQIYVAALGQVMREGFSRKEHLP